MGLNPTFRHSLSPLVLVSFPCVSIINGRSANLPNGILSINTDPDAPINTVADYVITGRIEDVVPKLIKYYKKNSK